MAKRGKKYLEARQKVDRTKRYSLREALELLPQLSYAKFDETVELAVRLGVDPRKPEEMVRGSVVLPHGTGKEVKVLVFAKGEKEKEAREAGADFVGGEELVEKIEKEGWFEFDRVVATPDMMKVVSRLGKILGPRGLMPSAKTGTVTFDVAKLVKELKGGRIEYKVDKYGNVHVPVGKVSFGPDKLYENTLTVLDSIIRAKPPTSKGTYIRSITLSTTMSPGVKVNPDSLREALKA